MKMLFCWRCQCEMPMLDEAEFDLVAATWSQCAQVFPRKAPLREMFDPALDEYEKLTGYRETNPNALWHHRIALYGPPCSRCGKPLRSPKAAFCAACGERATETFPLSIELP